MNQKIKVSGGVITLTDKHYKVDKKYNALGTFFAIYVYERETYY